MQLDLPLLLRATRVLTPLQDINLPMSLIFSPQLAVCRLLQAIAHLLSVKAPCVFLAASNSQDAELHGCR